MTHARRLTVVLVLVLVGAALAPITPAEAGRADVVTGPAMAGAAQVECGGGRLREPEGVLNEPGLFGKVPVVLVHGITSSTEMWSSAASDGDRNLAVSLDPLAQTSVWSFDYHDASIDWVTDRRIGPALAETIRCLADASDNQVVLVAHSMGGLAIRYALGQPGVAERVAHVTTIGTPFEGSAVLTLLNRGVDRAPLSPAVGTGAQVMLEACAQLTQDALESGGSGCFITVAGVPGSPVGTALMVGSREIAALPAWPSSVPVFRVAGDIRLRPLPGMDVSVGDGAVMRESALGGGVPDSVPPKVIPCTVTGSGVSLVSTPSVLRAGRCSHTGLVPDREVIQAVLAQVTPVIDRLAEPTPLGGGGGEGGEESEVEGAVVTPGFPRQLDIGSQGGAASAVYLAVTSSFDDPAIATAVATAESVGYEAGQADLGCDVGAAQALGRDNSFAAAVAVYFDSEENANLARDEFERRGIAVVGVANITFLCAD